MEVYSKLKYSRLNPYKARNVAKLIKGKDIEEASAILKSLPHKGARIIYKVLQSAIANAVHNYEMDKEKLFVERVIVDEGTPFRRVSPRAFGRADIIKRRTSHITVYVTEKEI
jgi:large subunit ribosomal protein L22